MMILRRQRASVVRSILLVVLLAGAVVPRPCRGGPPNHGGRPPDGNHQAEEHPTPKPVDPAVRFKMFQDSVRVLNPAMIARAKVEIDSAKADCDYLVALLPDGSVRTYYRDGTVVTQFPEGGIETRYPDGVTSRTHAQTIPSTPPPSAPPAADMAAWLGTIEAGLLDQIRALAGSEVDVNNYLASEPGVAPTVYARIQKRLDLVAHMTHAVLSGKGGRK